MRKRCTDPAPHRTWRWAQILVPVCAVMVLTGCSTPRPIVQEPRVTVAPPSRPGVEVVRDEASTGQLVKFGHLRTVIRSNEQVEPQQGAARKVEELRPELERELARRDFRLFSDAVVPAGDVAQLSRATRAQLILDINARSSFVNSTGAFSRYRADGEIRALRGRDGTLLAVARAEELGPRHQDDHRAGLLALREIGPSLTEELIGKLIDKQTQLQWAGLIINRVNSAAQAQSILRQLEQSPYVDYVELLDWNDTTREATYELIYGLRHDSDLIHELGRVQGMTIRPTTYEPGNMRVFQEILRRYK